MSRCVLFLLNKRGYDYGDYGCEYGCGGCGACANCTGKGGTRPGELPWSRNSGLFNSCAFVVDMLNASGVPARLIQIANDKDICNAIASVEPTDIVFEAFFAAPETVNKITKAHPSIRCFVRNHSEILFLSHDSNAMNWIAGYLRNPHMHVSSNTARSVADLRRVARAYHPHWDEDTVKHRVELLPNYHPVEAPMPRIPSPFGVLNVGCLGAIRQQKNHLLQAVSALEVARRLEKRLRFHVNANRVEHLSGGTLKNLRALFRNAPNAELVEHDWLNRPQFLDLCRRMDIGMQVSLSETFNIVTADCVQENVPVLGSPEIPWIDKRVQADPSEGADIIKKMLIALRSPSIVRSNRVGLLQYNERSRQAWLGVFGQQGHGWTDAPRSLKARPAITSVATHL